MFSDRDLRWFHPIEKDGMSKLVAKVFVNTGVIIKPASARTRAINYTEKENVENTKQL